MQNNFNYVVNYIENTEYRLSHREVLWNRSFSEKVITSVFTIEIMI